MEKRRLYKIKYSNGKVEKVEWDELPSWRKDEILEGREAFKFSITFFPIMAIAVSFIVALIEIFR